MVRVVGPGAVMGIHKPTSLLAKFRNVPRYTRCLNVSHLDLSFPHDLTWKLFLHASALSKMSGGWPPSESVIEK